MTGWLGLLILFTLVMVGVERGYRHARAAQSPVRYGNCSRDDTETTRLRGRGDDGDEFGDDRDD